MQVKKGLEIEQESFSIIDSEIGDSNGFTVEQYAIVRRVIHATGDFEFARTIRFHPQAILSGLKAIRQGKNILVDVRMVEAGIHKKKLAQWGGKVFCFIDHEEVVATAQKEVKTRAETAIELGLSHNIGIVAIGNAPTALIKVMEIFHTTDNRVQRPDLVIGAPVGFVNAAESKAALSKQNYPFITTLGRKGGSPVACSIVNALLNLMSTY
jgi:precorrin-8X/cobalt-precorrin-8 methylmutase